MTFHKLLLAVSLSFPLIAFAEGVDPEVDADIRGWRANMEPLKKIRDENRDLLIRNQGRMDQCKRDRNCHEEYVRDLKATVETQGKTVRKHADQVATLEEKASNRKAQIEKSNSQNRINNLLATYGVLLDMNHLREEFKDQQAMLTNLENKIDREATGIYLQNKMYALLNSQVMCSAVARCTTDKKMVIDKSRMKEVFPNNDPNDLMSGDFLHQRALDQKNSGKSEAPGAK